jgi:nucleoside 2-deoxyribosyltransferase
MANTGGLKRMTQHADDPKVTAYVASPLGFTESNRFYYKKVFIPALQEIGIQVIDPWQMTTPAEADRVMDPNHKTESWERYERFESKVGKRNEKGIREAMIVVANLDGPDADAGTSSEVGFAYGIGKRCYGIRTDWRNSGELVGKVALQVAYFVRESGGLLHYGELATFLHKLDEAIEPIRTLLRSSERVTVSFSSSTRRDAWLQRQNILGVNVQAHQATFTGWITVKQKVALQSLRTVMVYSDLQMSPAEE